MKKTFWMVTIIITLIAVNVVIVMAFYNSISGSSSKDNVTTTNIGNVNVMEKHPLDYLTLKKKLSDGFGEYTLNGYKSKTTMNAKIDDMLLIKQGKNIVLTGKLTNDSTVELSWILINIKFFNSAGHNIDFIAYPVINSRDGDKPLKQGESIKLDHVFEDGFGMMKNSNEWDGRFSVEILTSK